jgi:hypothetical protein
MKEEVLIFLEGVKTHLHGDLANFNRLCVEAEELEKLSDSEVNIDGLKSSSSTDQIVANASTTTKQTTLSPNFNNNLNKEPKIFRSTIPHTIIALSIADLVGFLLGKLPVTPTYTFGNLKIFFSNELSDSEINFLTFFYRHGMVHTFFPKQRFGIKAHSSNPKNKLFFLEKDIIVLNANCLIEIIKKRFEIILSDRDLQPNMDGQFIKLKEHDIKRIKDLQLDIEGFKKSLPMI